MLMITIKLVTNMTFDELYSSTIDSKENDSKVLISLQGQLFQCVKDMLLSDFIFKSSTNTFSQGQFIQLFFVIKIFVSIFVER